MNTPVTPVAPSFHPVPEASKVWLLLTFDPANTKPDEHLVSKDIFATHDALVDAVYNLEFEERVDADEGEWEAGEAAAKVREWLRSNDRCGPDMTALGMIYSIEQMPLWGSEG